MDTLPEEKKLIKLLPCPFCGGYAKIQKGHSEYWGICEICTAASEMKSTYYHASEAWNRRYNG